MWFRRDLRSQDNAALYHALRACRQVHCAFVFDRDILDGLPRADRRVDFIRESLVELDRALRDLAGHDAAGLLVLHDRSPAALPRLAQELQVQAVFANHDDEPASLARDATVRSALADAGIALHTSKDHLVFERQEVMTQAGTAYTVYTPYRKAWLARLDEYFLRAYPVERHAAALAPRPPAWRKAVPTLADIDFKATNLAGLQILTGMSGARRLLDDFLPRMGDYRQAREYPGVHGPSYLGVHLRFGTVSVRELARTAHARAARGDTGAATWLDELIWRDFMAQILANFPHVADEAGNGRNFRPAYDAVRWARGKAADALFEAWCEGRTGYPLVDAAMLQLNRTGYMHNRLRMVVASFLSKDLGLAWQRGERWFARQLNDYELASNNGNWQWAASTGCDAQPWFRIFNPVTQSRRFDAEGRFILHYLPQLAGLPAALRHAPWTASAAQLAQAGLVLGRDYPLPIVQHDEARARTLERYGAVRDRPTASAQ